MQDHHGAWEEVALRLGDVFPVGVPVHINNRMPGLAP